MNSKNQKAIKIKQQSDPRQKPLSQILEQLNYPTLRETCFICTFSILSNSVKTCLDCKKNFHNQCILKLKSQYQTRFVIHGSQIMQCPFCYQKQNCLQCHRFWTKPDTLYTCSICYLHIHTSCSKVPTWIIDKDYRSQQRKKYIVCKYCRERWGVRSTLQTLHRKQTNQCYVLVLINHPSPIHYTWISSVYVSSQDEDLEIVPSEADIQLILSIHIPTEYISLQPVQVARLVTSPSRKDHSGSQTFKFLIKWKNWRALPTWQQQWVVREWKGNVPNLIHVIHMRWIECLQLPHRIILNKLADCINQFATSSNVFVQVRFIDTKCSEQEADIREQCQKIFKLYSQNSAQSIKASPENQNLKAEAVCRVINTIYFVTRNSSPVLLLAYQSRLRYWNQHLKQKCPFLTTMCISNSHHETVEMIRRHFMRYKNQQILFKFNILLLAYQQIQLIASNMDLKQVMDCCSLVLFDDNMPAIARCYYSQTLSPRIKLPKHLANTSKDSLKYGFSVAEASSLQSRSNQSILGKNSSIEIQPVISIRSEQDRLQTKQLLFKTNLNIQQTMMSQLQQNDKYKLIWEEYKHLFNKDQQKFSRQFSQIRRLVFLRYIIAFGLHFKSTEECLIALAEYDPSAFAETKNKKLLQQLLSLHMCGFIAAVHLFSSKKIQPTQQDLLAYFFFDIPVKDILKRIVCLDNLRKYFQTYRDKPESAAIGIEPTLVLQGKSATIRNWQPVIDLQICELVLSMGWGNWQGMSECRRSWSGKKKMTFREYFCFKLNGYSIKPSIFRNFIKDRVSDIASFGYSLQQE